MTGERGGVMVKVGFLADLRNPRRWQRPWPRHYGRALELIEEADRLGAGAVFLAEHHLTDDGYLPQPLTMAAAIAVRTRRIRIGTAVHIAPLRPPLQLAEDAALVDALSQGRLELGLGAGYRTVEYRAFGVDPSAKYEALDARIREVRRLLDHEVVPRPAQARVPLWCGYQRPVGSRRAGRLGEALLNMRRDCLAPYLQGLAEGGHDVASARMAGVVNLVVARDPEATWRRVAPHLAHFLTSYQGYRAEAEGRPPPPPIEEDDVARGTDRLGEVVVLTPAEAVEYLRARTAGLPVSFVLTWLSIANMPEDIEQEHVQLLSTEVGPAL